jgi:nitric oxide reductase NorD protein
MRERSFWYESHLLHDRAGRRAQKACERLGTAVHERILQAGDRLAESSPAVAQAFYRIAPHAWQALGPQGFEQWLHLGLTLLASQPPQREAAHGYFSMPARVVTAAGLGRIEAWCATGRQVAIRSRKLGGTYFEVTAPLVHRISPALFGTWAQAGLRLYGAAAWRGEFLAQAYFAATSALTVMTPEELIRWADLGLALQGTLRESVFFASLPAGFGSLTAGERLLLLDTALAVAPVDREAAAALYTAVPGALRRLAKPVRMRLLQALQLAGPVAGASLSQVLPVIGALIHDVPAATRLEGLELAVRVARTFPAGAVALLRSLPVAYEHTRHEAVVVWVERGLDIAANNVEAGKAYFALESRTSLQVLHASSTAATLSDVQGMLRKYVHMLSGRSASLRSTEMFQLRPPLEEFPLENEIALPLKVDLFPTYEENCAVYTFLAAQLAGRRAHGTYDANLPPAYAGRLVAYLRAPEHSPLLEEIFLVAEGFRVASALARAYRGLARQQRLLAAQFLAREDTQRVPSQSMLMDAVLAWLVSGGTARDVPSWLQPLASVLVPSVAPLASAAATVNDSLAVARALVAQLANGGERRATVTYGELALERAMAEALVDPYLDDDGAAANQAPHVESLPGPPPPTPPKDLQLELEQRQDNGGPSSPLSPEELQRLLEAGTDLRISQGYASDIEGLGLYISDLLGKLPAAQLDELRELLADAPRVERSEPRRWLERRSEGVSFYYDEWDYHIGDYRQRWCRLLELAVDGDAGEFFMQALTDHSDLIPEIRRQFQRIRPEMYRIVRGLEDGEDFDLNAVVDARVDRRARRPSSSRVYVARQREERDVATLFLIDMSASTDEPLQQGTPAAGDSVGRRRSPQRIIDVTKSALVVMAQALEEIGDAYAIYGFSGHGRDNVEFYIVKSFQEALTPAVKGRIGALEPKRSTRMGAALRHATEKMAGITSRSRHIILLSDGFPQDFDYGQDRRSNVYGLKDTTVALRECTAAGITPFCITVDKTGHDYLREMCDASRYMVIEDIAALPRELPKIYQRVVGG